MTVAVIGCGGVGLNVVQGARLFNASRIIAVDVQDHKLEFSYKFGATDVVNAREVDPVEAIKELTGGGTFARIWLHNGLVQHDGEKMSK